MKARKAAINQMHSVLVGAPDELRASMAGVNRGALVSHCARLRADVNRVGEPATTAKIVLRRLARRVQTLDGESPKPTNRWPTWSPTPRRRPAGSPESEPSHRAATDDRRG